MQFSNGTCLIAAALVRIIQIIPKVHEDKLQKKSQKNLKGAEMSPFLWCVLVI